MTGSDSKFDHILARKEYFKGAKVSSCKGFSNKEKLEGKLISLDCQGDSVILRVDIGGGEIFESSIPQKDVSIVERKKEILIIDAYRDGGPVWIIEPLK